MSCIFKNPCYYTPPFVGKQEEQGLNSGTHTSEMFQDDTVLGVQICHLAKTLLKISNLLTW